MAAYSVFVTEIVVFVVLGSFFSHLMFSARLFCRIFLLKVIGPVQRPSRLVPNLGVVGDSSAK